jgi:hypothetical protein
MSKGGDLSTGRMWVPLILLLQMIYVGVFLKARIAGPG